MIQPALTTCRIDASKVLSTSKLLEATCFSPSVTTSSDIMSLSILSEHAATCGHRVDKKKLESLQSSQRSSPFDEQQKNGYEAWGILKFTQLEKALNGKTNFRFLLDFVSLLIWSTNPRAVLVSVVLKAHMSAFNLKLHYNGITVALHCRRGSIGSAARAGRIDVHLNAFPFWQKQTNLFRPITIRWQQVSLRAGWRLELLALISGI